MGTFLMYLIGVPLAIIAICAASGYIIIKLSKAAFGKFFSLFSHKHKNNEEEDEDNEEVPEEKVNKEIEKMKKLIETPEDVYEVYQKKIDILTVNCDKAYENYKKTLSHRSLLVSSLEEDVNKKEEYDNNIRSLMKSGKQDEAKVIAIKAAQLKKVAEAKRAELSKFEVVVDDIKRAYETLNTEIEKLKNAQEDSVRKYELSMQIEEIYDSMKSVYASTGMDNAINETVKMVKHREARAQGAKDIHEQNLDARISMVMKDNVISADDYIKELTEEDNEGFNCEWIRPDIIE